MSSLFIANGAEAYDAHMGRWSLRLATPFLEFSGIRPGATVEVPPDAGDHA